MNMIFTFSIFSITLISGLLAGKMNAKLPSFAWAQAFVSGVFLGTALFHLLPHRLLAYALCGLSFLSLFVLDRSLNPSNSREPTQLNHLYLPFIFLSIHSFIEGCMLGINRSLGSHVFVFFAVFLHKALDGFALGIHLKRTELNPRYQSIMMGALACMTPLGIFLGTQLDLSLKTQMGQGIQELLNALASGAFIYLAVHHHRHHRHNSWSYRAFFALGFLPMMLLAYIV